MIVKLSKITILLGLIFWLLEQEHEQNKSVDAQVRMHVAVEIYTFRVFLCSAQPGGSP